MAFKRIPLPPSSASVFFTDGDPDGVWIITKKTWSGRILRFPRNLYSEVKKSRPEISETGVYILVGETEEGSREIYVGETADSFGARLGQHYAKLDFWNEAVLILGPEGFSGGNGKFMEAELIRIATDAKRYKVVTKPMKGPSLSEADLADMSVFLSEALSLLPLLGITAFEEAPSDGIGERFVLAGAEARGQRTKEGFLVFAGAKAKGEVSPAAMDYKKVMTVRDELVSTGALVDEGENLRLTEDFVFSSPSLAATVLLGYPVSGPQFWKTETGKTLKEVEAAEAES